MKKLHVYYTDQAYWNVFSIFNYPHSFINI